MPGLDALRRPRAPDSRAKKKSLPFLIGPPIVPPGWFCLNAARSGEK